MRFCNVRQQSQCFSLIACILTVSLLWSAAPKSHAQFADQSMGWTTEQEKAVSGYLTRRLQRQGVVINDIWLEYWTNERAEHLRAASTAPMSHLSTLLIREQSFNAFALPGNITGYNIGLWKTAETEAEFVAVMAHELAHLNLRHFSRLADANRQQAWLSISGAILGIALASTNPDLAGATFFGSQLGAAQQRLAFSRAMETEADRFSARLLSETGYDPGAGARLFQRLQAQTSFQPGLSDYWQTHPLTSTRIANMAQLEDQRNGSEPAPDHHYPVLRWHLNKAHSRGESFATAPAVYRENAPTNDDDTTLFPPALLQNAEPNLLFGWLIYYQNEFSLEQYQARLSMILRLFPDFDPAYFYLAKARWQQQQDANTCRQAIEDLGSIKATYMEVLEFRTILTKTCQPERETEALANYYWYQGEESRAMSLLRGAISNPSGASQLARQKQLLTTFEQQRSLLPR
ncbi:MAG: M48 family metalloprotease [Saccharospirillum sp.]|nr:M48 family metalloprotease [Saccharospirillum sp.]